MDLKGARQSNRAFAHISFSTTCFLYVAYVHVRHVTSSHVYVRRQVSAFMWDVFMRVRVCTCTFTCMLWYVLYTYICMSLYERELIETFHWSNTWWLVTSYAKYYTDDDVMKALKTDKRLQYGGHLLFFGTIINFFFSHFFRFDMRHWWRALSLYARKIFTIP